MYPHSSCLRVMALKCPVMFKGAATGFNCTGEGVIGVKDFASGIPIKIIYSCC